jgi:hypothetical protein
VLLGLLALLIGQILFAQRDHVMFDKQIKNVLAV